MLLRILLLIFLFSSAALAQRQAFLKVEDGDPLISVFNEKGIGENWKYCEKNAKGECVNANGWLDKDAKITVLGDIVKRKTTDPFTNKEVEEEYYPIEFEYTRNGWPQKNKGYIEAAYIGFKKHKSLMKPPEVPKSSGGACTMASMNQKKILEDTKCAIEFQAIDDIAKKVKERIGACADPSRDTDKTKNIYDNLILNKVKSAGPPNMIAENGQKISTDDMVAIDSLSRTLYGEMASCYKHGLEYPMAVARIALNRAENTKRASEFIKKPHESNKPPLSKVVTSASQFNVWLRKLNSEANPSAQMALCPASNPKQTLLTGRAPSKQELAIWNHTVRIATEAVLFPEMFKKRTDNLKGLYFYTSGMGKFFNMKKQSRHVEGRPIDKARCLEIWQEQPKTNAKKVSSRFPL